MARAAIQVWAWAAIAVVGAGCKHASSTSTASAELAGGPAVAPAAEASAVVIGATAPPPADLPKSVDPKDLDAAERKILGEILSEQFDPCGKTRSFMEALRAGDCPIAPQLAAKLVDFLGPQGMGKQKAVAALLREIERINTVVAIDVAGAPSRGPADSKAVIVEFSDFECPFCRRAIEPLEKLRKHYNAVLYYKFYPLKQHPNAEGAARAAWAAQRQGKFWEMHDLLFANQQALDWPAVQGYAKQLKLDAKIFEADVNSPAAKAAVAADEKAGEAALVDGTPTFYVNGRKGETLGQVQEMVREALQAAGQKLPAPLSEADVDEAGDAPAKAEPAGGGKPAEAAK